MFTVSGSRDAIPTSLLLLLLLLLLLEGVGLVGLAAITNAAFIVDECVQGILQFQVRDLLQSSSSSLTSLLLLSHEKRGAQE
jgi:hypothetical protein